MTFESLESRRLLAAVVLREQVNDFGDSEFADDVAVQKDGRSIVLGHTENAAGGDQLFLARYDEDGTLDTFFGINGRVVGTFDNFRRASSLTIDKSGRMIVAGITSDADPAVAAMRFTKSGFLDTSFGNVGLAILQAGTGEVVNDVAVDASGRVIVAGQTLVDTAVPSTPTPVFMVARFDAFGRRDVFFGGEDFGLGDGVTAFPVGIGESGANSVVIDSNNRILVGGFGTEQESGQAPEKRLAIARLDSFGSLDDDFGEGRDGIVVVDIGLPSVIQAITRAKDGKIVAAGNTLPTLGNEGEQIVVARFTKGGSLDSSFGGGDGFNLFAIGGARSLLARGVAVDSKSRVLVAGEISDTGDPIGDFDDDRPVLARFLADGSPDTSFATGGVLIEEAEPGVNSVENVAGLAIQKDGKDPRVIVAGNAGTSLTDQDIAVYRVATDSTQGSGSARINGAKLLVKGTDRNDTITVSQSNDGSTIDVNVNGFLRSFPRSAVARIEMGCKDGDDDATCSVGGDVITTILGQDGDDDLAFLGDTHGRIEGGDGDDDIQGGNFKDRLRGGRGDDVIFGGDGDDDITGDSGFDKLFGEDGDDELKADDGYHDDVDGGDDDDSANVDFFDFVTRVDDVDVK